MLRRNDTICDSSWEPSLTVTEADITGRDTPQALPSAANTIMQGIMSCFTKHFAEND